MTIHVVKQGENLYDIAKYYGVNLKRLISANQVTYPNQLVPGQTILIPMEGHYHILKSGESLYTISKEYGVPVDLIKKINRFEDPEKIPNGTKILLPPPTEPLIYTSAYLDPKVSGKDSITLIKDVGMDLTYLNIFTYAVNRDGSLTPVKNDQSLIDVAKQENVAPILVLSNFENGTFSTDLATSVLSRNVIQDKIIDNVLAVLEEKNYYGLDIDFEYLGKDNRERYNDFLRKVKDAVSPKYTLSVALAPKTSGEQKGLLYEGHDYETIGGIVDMIFLMTYEWGWSGGPPQAVSPIDEVRKVLEYAITVIPRDKVMMGIPYYGYDWTLPYVKGGEWAKSITPQDAVEIANKYRVRIQYDEKSQAPYFYYTDKEGDRHVVWFEDARSLQAKFNLVKELGIRGLFYWVLRKDFYQNWILLEENFEIKNV